MISLSWLPAALPILGAAVKGLSGVTAERRLERRVRRHAQLLAAMPEQTDRAKLSRLIDRELEEVAMRNEWLLDRRVNGPNLVRSILVLLLGTLCVFLFWNADAVSWLRGWAVTVSRIIAVLIGLEAFFFVAIGGLPSFWTTHIGSTDQATTPDESVGAALQGAPKEEMTASIGNSSRQS